MVQTTEELPALIDERWGAGQGDGAKRQPFNFAGGWKGLEKAADAAAASGRTVATELVQSVKEAASVAGNNSVQARGSAALVTCPKT